MVIPRINDKLTLELVSVSPSTLTVEEIIGNTSNRVTRRYTGIQAFDNTISCVSILFLEANCITSDYRPTFET